MAYSELFKNYSDIRNFMRRFYVYGFEKRQDFTAKSSRSYDDNRRRLDSWLENYMSFKSDADGRAYRISLDSEIAEKEKQLKDERKAKVDSILDSVGSLVGVGKSAAVEKENTKLKAENERMKKAFAKAVKDKAEERAKALTAEKLKAETERDRALAQSRSLAAERDQVINQLQAQIDGEEHRIGFAVSRAMEKRDKTIRLLQNALKVSSYILKQFADMLYKASEVFKRAVDAIIHFGTDKYKSVFAPQEAADIKSVMQEYGETTEQKKAVGEWLCYYAESNKPFDTIKHRHTLKEVGDVAEGKYDWKIDRQINGSIKL